MDLLGTVHFVTALAALGSGLTVMLLPKGRKLHRRAGWAYVACMLVLNVTALSIYDLLGRFGPFHFAALVSLITIAGGLLPVLRRRPRSRWTELHAYWMSWSYVGLVAAAASETTTRYLRLPFWWLVLIATLSVAAIGAFLVHTRVPIVLRRFRRPAELRSASSSG